MKKIFLTLIISALYSGIFSQTLELYYEDELLESDAEITLIAHPDSGMMDLDSLWVKNISIDSIEVKCARTIIDTVAGSQNVFCWGSCYPPFTDTSLVVIIQPDTFCHKFLGHHDPKGFEGITKVKYVFYDANNINDQVTFFANYNATFSASINDINSKVTLSNAYPNPANMVVNFDYDMHGLKNGKVIIYDLLGSVVKDIEIPKKFGSLKLNTSDLIEGIYFYSLRINNEAIKTRKLIIKH